MTDGKKALGQLVGISLMIGFMVVGCGQGTQTVSNTGEDITSNTETEISETRKEWNSNGTSKNKQ